MRNPLVFSIYMNRAEAKKKFSRSLLEQLFLLIMQRVERKSINQDIGFRKFEVYLTSFPRMIRADDKIDVSYKHSLP